MINLNDESQSLEGLTMLDIPTMGNHTGLTHTHAKEIVVTMF